MKAACLGQYCRVAMILAMTVDSVLRVCLQGGIVIARRLETLHDPGNTITMLMTLYTQMGEN